MPVSLVKSVNFGSSLANLTGSSGVGYAIFNTTGGVVSPRTTSGVYQLATGSGIYAAYVTFPDTFHGHIFWDAPSGSITASYATEEFNVEANDPRVASTWEMVNSMTGTLQSVYDIGFGRWRIVNNQMLFYKADNTTLVATFDLYDSSGNPTMDGVFERRKV